MNETYKIICIINAARNYNLEIGDYVNHVDNCQTLGYSVLLDNNATIQIERTDVYAGFDKIGEARLMQIASTFKKIKLMIENI